jgi:hypothetical protein
MTRDQILQMQNASRVYQERYDDAFSSWGMRTPAPPLPTRPEDVDEYRRSLAVQAKKLLPDDHQYRKVQYRRLDDAVLNNLEPQLLKAVIEAGRSNDSVPLGSPLREVHKRGPNGEHVIKFLGQRHFIHDFKSPVRYVTSFTTNQGRWMSNRGWF